MKATPPAAPMPPPYVDLVTAARLARCSRRTVQKKLSSGEIPPRAVKMEGRQKRVAIAALEAVFEQLQPFTEASPPEGERPGSVHGNVLEPSELAELRAKIEAKDSIIASLQSTLDHERQDRAHERENWRKTLERTQGNLLAAQDTPTARAIAGAPPPAPSVKPKPRRTKKKAARPWWQRVF